MPFSGPDDKSLPSNVKKLGAKQKRRWVSVFNSAFSRCKKAGNKDCEASAFKQANGVLKNASMTYTGMFGREHPLGRTFIELQGAEPPESINVFPSPGIYKHPVWGDVEVTEEGNEHFVQNFNDQVYQEHVAIDAEHESKLSGAVGYMKKLTLNEDGSIEAEVEWNERGTKLIADDSYKYISPEWYEKWTDPSTSEDHENVLIGAALTTRPFFKDLRSLVASEGKLYDAGSEEDSSERIPVVKSAIEGISHNDLQSLVMSAARHEFPGVFGHSEYGGWVVDLYDDYAIIESGGHYYRADYGYSGEEVMFSGQPSEVMRHTVWNAAPNRAATEEEDRMAEINVEDLEIEKLEEKDQQSLLQRLASTLKATVSFGGGSGNGDEEEEEKEEEKEEEEEEGKEGASAKTAVEVATLTTKLAASEKLREASDQRLSGLETESLERRLRDIVLGRDEPSVKQAKESEGAIVLLPMVGALAPKVEILRALGEGSDAYKAYIASEREHASQLREAGTFAEVGADSQGGPAASNPSQEFEERITALTGGDKPMDRDVAIAKIAKEDPKLYERYDKAVSGRKGSFSGTGAS